MFMFDKEKGVDIYRDFDELIYFGFLTSFNIVSVFRCKNWEYGCNIYTSIKKSIIMAKLGSRTGTQSYYLSQIFCTGIWSPRAIQVYQIIVFRKFLQFMHTKIHLNNHERNITYVRILNVSMLCKEDSLTCFFDFILGKYGTNCKLGLHV